MNKIAIPAILVATVMVAGMFAFMPVEQASTVHLSGTITTTSTADTAAIKVDTAAILVDTDTTIPASLITIDDFIDNEIAAILVDTDTTIPASLITIDDFLDNEIGTIITSTGTTLPNEHAALPSITEVTDLSAPTTLTAPGTLVSTGTAGIAYVTCSGYTQNTATDTLTVGGTTYADIQDVEFVIAITSGQAILWVQNTADDTATCTAILMS